ncbi:hypothetical protein CH380_11130 [Leptospira adleri]|uniref:Uncharacterized protein n=1 Tax=Leptospira adleri TaxID=2023186 RepID=A0A2M9YP79_9LEPT|nr:hypothetical protein CH380_11130 [Leptospira adleri]PJZ59892.1 hypothetical protein CH376_21290 [Leptospira adleri]
MESRRSREEFRETFSFAFHPSFPYHTNFHWEESLNKNFLSRFQNKRNPISKEEIRIRSFFKGTQKKELDSVAFSEKKIQESAHWMRQTIERKG